MARLPIRRCTNFRRRAVLYSDRSPTGRRLIVPSPCLLRKRTPGEGTVSYRLDRSWPVAVGDDGANLCQLGQEPSRPEPEPRAPGQDLTPGRSLTPPAASLPLVIPLLPRSGRPWRPGGQGS